MKKPVIAVLSGGILAALILLRPAGEPGANVPQSRNPPPVATAARQIEPAPASRALSPSLHLVSELTSALRSANGNAQERAFNRLLPELIAMNAAVAGRLAEEWEPGPMREELLRQVTRQWTAMDFAGAMAWLAGLENRRDQQAGAEAGATEIARTDPAAAIEVFQIFAAGTNDGRVEHAAQLWTEESPDEAVDWIVSRPPGPQRDRLMARIAFVRAQSDPAEGAILATNFISAGAARDDAIAAVARQWAVRDPAAATAWVEQFPAGTLRTRGLAEVALAQKFR